MTINDRLTPLQIAMVTLLLAVAACTPATDPSPRGGAQPAPGAATPTPPTTPDTPLPGADPGAAANDQSATDPCAGPADTTRWLLREMRSAAHADHDRVVFEFCGGRERPVFTNYIDQMVEHPSGRPVRLAGNAFLALAIDLATLDTARPSGDPSRASRYSGPRRWSPGHRLVKEIAVVGDYANTLHFGLGLAQPATLTLSQLTAPQRVVIDLWYEPTNRLLWPVHTVAQAHELQQAFDEGHQPWVGSPEQVITFYLRQEQGWREPDLRRLSDNLYTASADGRDALVAIGQPARSGAGGVWVVTWYGPSSMSG